VYPHHREAIEELTRRFEADPEPTAVYLAGSIAHGFERPDSDIDLVIVVDDEAYAERAREHRLHFYDLEVSDHPGVLAEGKYVSESLLEQVARHGSEPARFALHDVRRLVGRVDYTECFARIARYPVEGKLDRLRRFFAQVEAWHWYFTEALRLENPYLLGTATSKLVLFGGRLVLTRNERLYPYHKWFLRVLETAEDKPDGLMAAIDALYREPTRPHADRFRELVIFHGPWEVPAAGWPSQFVIDSELNWLDGEPPVDDL
jgi:predicted nucleotidyltransferase